MPVAIYTHKYETLTWYQGRKNSTYLAPSSWSLTRYSYPAVSLLKTNASSNTRPSLLYVIAKRRVWEPARRYLTPPSLCHNARQGTTTRTESPLFFLFFFCAHCFIIYVYTHYFLYIPHRRKSTSKVRVYNIKIVGYTFYTQNASV